MPGRRESAEMVQSNQVDMSQQCPHAIDAPAVTRAAKRIPVIDRIAPKLSVRAEVIGRHAGDELRPALFGQKEDVGVRPDIAGIGRHEEGQVTDEADAVCPRVRFQSLALTEDQELHEAGPIDCVDSSLRASASLGNSLHQFRGQSRKYAPLCLAFAGTKRA